MQRYEKTRFINNPITVRCAGCNDELEFVLDVSRHQYYALPCRCIEACMETEEYKKHGWGSNVKDYKEYAERTQKEDAQREVETLEAITNKITEKVTKAHKKYLTDEINKPVDNG